MFHRIRPFAIAVALFLSLAGSAEAALYVRPSLTLEERYDTNIRFDREEEDDNSDFISVISPALTARQMNGRAELKVFYGLDVYLHSQNTQFDNVRHRAGIDARFEPGKVTTLSFGDKYYYTEDSLEAADTGILLVRTDIRSNTAYINLNRQLTPRTDIGAGLRSSTLDFRDPALVDSRTDSATLAAGYAHKQDGKTTLGYTYRDFRFNTAEDKSIETHGVQLALREPATPTLDLDIAAGAVLVKGDENDYYLTALVGLSKEYKDSKIALAYTRDVTNPTGLTNEININDRVTLNIDHTVSRNTALAFLAQLAKNKSEPSGRVDINSYTTQVSGTWQPYRWLILGAGVSHYRQWKNDTLGAGFVRNQVFLNVTFQGPEWRF